MTTSVIKIIILHNNSEKILLKILKSHLDAHFKSNLNRAQIKNGNANQIDEHCQSTKRV